MYEFDQILDDRQRPVVQGSPRQIQEWLKSNEWAHSKIKVCVGRTMEVLDVDEYLEDAEF